MEGDPSEPRPIESSGVLTRRKDGRSATKTACGNLPNLLGESIYGGVTYLAAELCNLLFDSFEVPNSMNLAQIIKAVRAYDATEWEIFISEWQKGLQGYLAVTGTKHRPRYMPAVPPLGTLNHGQFVGLTHACTPAMGISGTAHEISTSPPRTGCGRDDPAHRQSGLLLLQHRDDRVSQWGLN